MPPRLVPRRLALTGLGGSAALILAGCDVRLEQDAPRVPGLETQGPPSDTPALQQTVAGRESLLTSLTQPAAGWQTRLKPVYQAQLTRLQAVMASAGMPQASATASATVGTAVTPFALALRAQLGSGAAARIAGVQMAYTPMLSAISALDAAAARVIGSAAVVPPSGGLPPPIAAALVGSLREAVYALEVVAARTPIKSRTLATTTLHTLYPLRSRLDVAAGASAPAVQSSYRLVADPGTDSGRTRIAQHVLSGVVTACAGQSVATRGSGADVERLLDPWGSTLALSWQWGAAPTAFPGLVG